MRIFLTTCAIVLALLTVGLGVAHFVLHPPGMKIAVPASDVVDQRVFSLVAETLRSQLTRVRIEMVTVENAKAAMEALESGKVKLAVVRSDAALQGKAQTVVIMRREVGVLIAPKTGKVQKVADLSGATIGVTRDGPLDGGLMVPVLDYYGIPRDKIKYSALPFDEIAAAFRGKKVDAIIAVGAVASKQMGDVVAEAARGAKGAIQFIDIEESDAIVKRVQALESVEVDQGTFGGRPPRPADSFNTLGYSIRLVGTAKLDTDTVAELVRQLILVRQNIAAAIPGAGLMEVPDTDEAGAFLIHPGARAYANNEQKTLFDRYSDYIYLVAFLGSGIGSVAAGLFGLVGGRRANDPAAPLRDIQSVLDAVRDAKSADELDQLEAEADRIFRAALAHGSKDELSPTGIASFDMAMREFRIRLAARRQALAAGMR